MDDYTAANNYYALIDTMSELFAKAATLRIEAHYLAYERHQIHMIPSLLVKADELESSAYDYMYFIDSFHNK